MFRNCSGKKRRMRVRIKCNIDTIKINIYHAIGDIFSKFFFGG